VRQVGVVVELHDGEATVELRRHTACGNCGACWVGDAPRRFRATNPLGYECGSLVVLEISEQSLLTAAFYVYMVPLAIGGLVAGAVSVALPPLLAFRELYLCAALFGGMGVGFLGLRHYDRSGSFRGRYLPIVTGEPTDEEIESHERPEGEQA